MNSVQTALSRGSESLGNVRCRDDNPVALIGLDAAFRHAVHHVLTTCFSLPAFTLPSAQEGTAREALEGLEAGAADLVLVVYPGRCRSIGATPFGVLFLRQLILTPSMVRELPFLVVLTRPEDMKPRGSNSVVLGMDLSEFLSFRIVELSHLAQAVVTRLPTKGESDG